MCKFRYMIFNNGYPIFKYNDKEFKSHIDVFKEVYGNDYDDFEYRMNMNWFILPYKTSECNVVILADFMYSKFINFPNLYLAKSFIEQHHDLFGETVIMCKFPNNYDPIIHDNYNTIKDIVNNIPSILPVDVFQQWFNRIDYEVMYWKWNGSKYIHNINEGGWVVNGCDPVKCIAKDSPGN